MCKNTHPFFLNAVWYCRYFTELKGEKNQIHTQLWTTLSLNLWVECLYKIQSYSKWHYSNKFNNSLRSNNSCFDRYFQCYVTNTICNRKEEKNSSEKGKLSRWGLEWRPIGQTENSGRQLCHCGVKGIVQITVLAAMSSANELKYDFLSVWNNGTHSSKLPTANLSKLQL